jgi:nucleotide-binding universal stress UspA family protein
MALKDVLAHVDPSEAGKRRLCFACDLAARHGARLTALYVPEYSIDQQHRLRSAELGLASGERTAALNRAIRRELDEDADALRSMLAQLQQSHAIETVWRSIEGHAYKVVPQYARSTLPLPCVPRWIET